MAFRGLVLATFLLVSPASAQLPGAAPGDVGLSAERLAQADSALDAWVAEGMLPGGVLLVARHGRLAHLQPFGFRDRESRAPMRADAIFRIASQTKAIVSVAAMILHEEGRLSLLEPVGLYLPEFQNTTVAAPRADGGYDVVAAEHPISIRELLTHTAGVGYGYGVVSDRWEAGGIQGWYFADRTEPIRETVARMAALPFEAQPGERWIYGYSTDILGAVVEQVAGMPLDAFLRTRILDPLDMRDTRFYVRPDDRARLVTVYARTPEGLARAPDGTGMDRQGQYADGPRTSFSGGAGLTSTAGDYARFLQMLLNGGSLDGVRILSPTSVALMTTNHVGERYDAPGRGFGLGFEVVDDVGARGQPGSKGEFGWGGAYHSTYWVDPREQLVVVYLTQVRPATGLFDFARIRALVYGAITESAAN